MSKYIVLVDAVYARYADNIDEAKKYAQEAIEDGCEEASIYEKKVIAGIVKPKVEFKEV